jgi:hypothetical protein
MLKKEKESKAAVEIFYQNGIYMYIAFTRDVEL